MTLRELIKKAEIIPARDFAFGERLALIRHLRGFKSQGEAAEKLGILQSTLAMYESGSRTPKIDKVMKMAELYECSVDWLCGFSEEVERR